MNHPSCSLLIALSLASCLVSGRPVLADEPREWVDLTATFRYDGDPPESKKLVVDKDTHYVKPPLFDQSLQVDPKTKGIANVVAWFYVAPSEKQPPIHNSYAEAAKQDVRLETRNAQLEPHVCTIWTPQTLVVKNQDAIGHNTKGNFFANPAWGHLWPGNAEIKIKFYKQESRPMPLACSLHPWESGWILIRDNPYMAVSDSQGKLKIKNVPAGTHTFVFWHEQVGFIKEMKRDGKKIEAKNGRLTLAPREFDLGEIVIKPERNN